MAKTLAQLLKRDSTISNFTKNLDDIMVGDKNFGQGTLVSVTHLQGIDCAIKAGHVKMNMTIKAWLDDKPDENIFTDKWRTFAEADYRWIQQRALEKDSRLQVFETIGELQNPKNVTYTAMSIVVPTSRSKFGFMPVVMARPDVQYFSDGQPYVPLWFNSTAQPGFENAYLKNSGKSLIEVITEEAKDLVKPIAGENAFMFCDDQNTPGVEGLSRNGWKVFIPDLAVPILSAKGKALDKEGMTVNLLYHTGSPLINPAKARELIKGYLVDGYDVPKRGELMKQGMEKVNTAYGLI